MNNQATQSMYEDQKVISQYMEFHYGDSYFGVPNYPKQCADLCIKVCKDNGVPLEKALDLGCSVGRSTFELATAFEKVVGLDLSTGFITAAEQFQQEGTYEIAVPTEGHLSEKKALSLKALNLTDTVRRVNFAVEDAGKLDLSIYGRNDLIFCGNLIDRLSDPTEVLQNIHKYLNPKGIFVNVSPYTWLEVFSSKSKWVGGYVDQAGKEVKTHDGLKKILGATFKEVAEARDVEFVIRETKREYQHAFAHATFWQKIVDKKKGLLNSWKKNILFFSGG